MVTKKKRKKDWIRLRKIQWKREKKERKEIKRKITIMEDVKEERKIEWKKDRKYFKSEKDWEVI